MKDNKRLRNRHMLEETKEALQVYVMCDPRLNPGTEYGL